MSGENWTPGPWRHETDSATVWGDCDPHEPSTSGFGLPVAEVRFVSPGWVKRNRLDNATGIANARLIAAAPDLYEALRDAADALANVAADVDLPEVPSVIAARAEAAAARAAIAKARGEGA